MDVRQSDEGKKRGWHRWRFLLSVAVSRYPVLIAFTLTMALASIALGLVLDEQSKGRQRDQALKDNQVGLTKALVAIQSSRREAVKISCKTNRAQNAVLLALIDFSITQARAKGRKIDPEALAQTNELLKPITPEVTKAVCSALLKGITKKQKPRRYLPPPLVRP